MIFDIGVPAILFKGETKEREYGKKVLSPESHEPEIKTLSWDMEALGHCPGTCPGT